MANNFVNIGDQYGINTSRVIAVLPARRSAGKRIKEASDRQGQYIHACGAKSLKSLVMYDNGLVMGSYLNPRTLLRRLQSAGTPQDPESFFPPLSCPTLDGNDSSISEYEQDLLDEDSEEDDEE